MALFREKLFPLLSGLLWAVFLFLDISGLYDSTWVKFSAICLCAAAAWTGARTADGVLVAAALTLTVGADVFLLLLNRDMDDQLAGVLLFLAVQTLYACRLYRLRGRKVCRWGIVLRLAVPLILALGAFALLLAIGAGVSLLREAIREPLSTVLDVVFLTSGAFLSLLAARAFFSVLYFTGLCVNTAEAFALSAPSPVRRFAWGLLLFVGCDICVGCWNLGLLGDLARVGMWFFYLPSQVLIVLSQDTKGAFT